jgi:beta-glucosidase
VQPCTTLRNLRTLRLTALALVTASASLFAVSTAPTATAASAACPWVGSTAPISQRVSQLLGKMSVAQEVSLLTGTSGSSYVGFIPAIGSLCIPAIDLQDGPAGVGDGFNNVTQLPAPVDAAATFDTSAEQAYGQVIGSEQEAKGTTIDLGPTINITRDPRWGRAFESVGEDPYLNGTLGAAEIQGVQSTGAMAQVKHLAVYNQETNRNTPSDNAVIDNKPLQEIYLQGFHDSVAQGAASSVMCSYSTINGTYACENPYILTTALRQQFGFGGFVTSDWGATHSTAPSANSGLNMDMPGNDGFYGGALSSAVSGGSVSKATLDSLTSQVLTELFAFGLFDKPPVGSPAQTATSSAHVTTARQISEEGTVLLKNSGSVLPFGSSVSSIAIIGADASTSPQTDGGGSAGVNSSGTVTPLQGITARAGGGVAVNYNDGSNASSAASLAASSSVAVVFVSKFESEGSDLSNIDLASSDNSLISSVAAANPHTIVVVNSGSAVTMPWLNSVAGVFEAWYPGQEDGNAIAALLFGDVDPSGHLPVTFPTSLSQVPANTSAQWPGTNGQVQYSEGVDVGYRWYNAKNLTPLFPFGYGLSYTSFSFSNLSISPLVKGGASTVTATVTNTGSREGADVAQLYVTDPAASGEAPKNLEGFARVDLQPGASATVSFPLTQTNLQYWNDSSSAWATSTGNYTVSVGDSNANLPLTGTLSVGSAQLGQTVSVTNPGPQEGVAGTAVNVPISASDSTGGQTLSYSATGLPAGTSINAGTGAITGTPSGSGTSTVAVTARDGSGAFASQSFTWTVSPAGSGVPTTPLINSNGQCLDLPGDSNTDGTAVQVYNCNGTNGQQWTEGTDGTVHADGKCLNVAGTAVQIATCNGSGAQQWQPQSNGELVNTQSGQCLTDPGAANGTQVQISACTDAGSQQWHSPAGSNNGGGGSTGQVTGYQGLCLDVRGANSADGTPVQVYTCNGTNAQQWTVASNSTLQALGKCLDVASGGTANGTKVQLYTCNGTGAQQWQPGSNSSLVNPQSGKCLDVTGFGGSGTQVQIWACSGSSNQAWTLP